MDKKSLLMFFGVAIMLLSGHALLVRFVLPPPPPVAKVPEKPPVDKAPADTPEIKPDPAQPADPARPDVKPPVENPPDQGEVKPPVQPEKPAVVPPAWVTLGSLDPNSGFQMLVTLTNRGAALERVELRDYYDIEDRRGYLGQLYLAAHTGSGCLVREVGAGTPAAMAGLRPNDVLISINKTTIDRPQDLDKFLAGTEPGQKLTLSVLQNDKPAELSVVLGRIPLQLIRPQQPLFQAVVHHPSSLRMTLDQVDAEVLKKDKEHVELPGVRIRDTHWTLWDDATQAPLEPTFDAAKPRTSVTFRTELTKPPLEIFRRYSLQPATAGQLGYEMICEVEFHNLDEAPHKIAYQLDGPNGLPIEGWWYASKVSGEGLRDIVDGWSQADGTLAGTGLTGCRTEAGKLLKNKTLENWTPQSDKKLRYLGVDAQHFAAVLKPLQQPDTDNWFSLAEVLVLGAPDKEYLQLANTSFRLTSKPKSIEGGKTLVHHFKLFAGPKETEVLAHYELDQLLDYGWFGWVATLMTSILHFFYALVGNYGIAIIMLTILVRSCMLPLSLKQAHSAAKMQELQPEMAKLKEKYKNNKEEMARAQMALFDQHGVKPFFGCVLALAQLPIFIGLYRGLQADIALRDAPLISQSFGWAADLAAPDKLFYWEPAFPFLTGYNGYLGPFFNILPIITIVLFLVQQKMFTPPPTDEQQEMTQKMMKFMMIFMGVLFFKVASGLCLYFIASSAWGVGERLLLPKLTKSTPSPTPTPATADASPGFKWPWSGDPKEVEDKLPRNRKQKGRK